MACSGLFLEKKKNTEMLQILSLLPCGSEKKKDSDSTSSLPALGDKINFTVTEKQAY